MGAENPSRKEAFTMNIQLIGTNLNNFKNSLSETKSKYSIQNYWTFSYDNNLGVNSQINTYFDKLEKFKNGKNKTLKLKECLLVKIKDISDPEVNLIIEHINSLGQVQYMPLVLFLLENNFSKKTKLWIDKKKFERIDPRLIMATKFEEENPKIIEPLLLRFCSIHNELGDRFTIGDGNDIEDYDLVEHYFPFNINIACIGRFGQGKSTGVNAILKEYKAKESSRGSCQTKSLTFYQVRNQPIKILDIPGFEDKETVIKAVEKFRQCGEKINKIKDNLHIVLYFLNYQENRAFANLELPMLEELCKHKSSKVIYVITYSNPNMSEQNKKDKIDNINDGLQNVTKDSSIFDETIEKEEGKKGMLVASSDNVVFVNFHRDNKNGYEPFGTKELFKKIYEFFINTEDYVNSNKTMDDNYLKQKAKELRARANDALLANKIAGGAVGIIPGVDWLIQKFVIKKSAARKVGEIYGIDVKFLDEKGKNANINKYEPEYITASVDKKQLTTEIKGEELIKSTFEEKLSRVPVSATEAQFYLMGGAVIEGGKFIVSNSTKADQILTLLGLNGINAASTGARIAGGCVFFVFAAGVGVLCGALFTRAYCEDLIDRFENYYLNNAQKIGNSYKEAIKYLSNEFNN